MNAAAVQLDAVQSLDERDERELLVDECRAILDAYEDVGRFYSALPSALRGVIAAWIDARQQWTH